MKKSAKVTLTVVAVVGLASCGRRRMDPCEASYFNQQACQEAIDSGGYYWRGSWFPMVYHYPYPYYFDSYRGYVSHGGRVYTAPSGAYGHSTITTPSGGDRVDIRIVLGRDTRRIRIDWGGARSGSSKCDGFNRHRGRIGKERWKKSASPGTPATNRIGTSRRSTSSRPKRSMFWKPPPTNSKRMTLAAAQHVIDNRLYDKMGIPEIAIPLIEASWEAEPPSLYGRFDLAYDGIHPPKLLEYNADTPTSLLEAAVVQWHWLQDLFPKRDQFNSIHERLIALWQELKPYLPGERIDFCSMDDAEDGMTVTYLQDTAQQAGLTASIFPIDEIGWNGKGVRGTGRSAARRDVQAVSLGMDGAGSSSASISRLGADSLDGAGVEDAAFEQGHSAGFVEALPAASESAGGELRRAGPDDVLDQEAAARARGREHHASSAGK